MTKAPWGLEVIRMWASRWIAGKVPESVIEYWTHGLVAPPSKKSGNGVRPITLFETAYKLATGLALDLHKPKIIKAVGAFQYGALLASGADRFVYGVRALARLDSKLCFLATDIKNAFGTVPRVEALKALLLHLPTLAPIMANTWLAKFTPLAAPNSVSGFGIIHACEGVYQGECLSTAVFCIFLRMVLDTFVVNCSNAGIDNAERTEACQ